MEITFEARLLFLIDCSIAVTCVRRPSLAISPDGSSLPELIFNPVESRVNDFASDLFDFSKFLTPVSDGTFELMRVISDDLSLCFWQTSQGLQLRARYVKS